ncbi:MAG: NPCBM/NEW2 domain-containing protein [Firmicutes bacterium]|nr:NPCBM/NEW2 domain-containing protein [Bacillota bacterium]
MIASGSKPSHASALTVGQQVYIPAFALNKINGLHVSWNPRGHRLTIVNRYYTVPPKRVSLTSLPPEGTTDFSYDGVSPGFNVLMVIDGRGYTQGVTFPSGSSTYVESVSYDLGGNYHTLSGVVGFDKKSLGTNPVFFDITTPMPDSNLTETLYSMTLGPNNLADKFLINVSGVDTLTLQVDYADGGSTANYQADYAHLELSR